MPDSESCFISVEIEALSEEGLRPLLQGLIEHIFK